MYHSKRELLLLRASFRMRVVSDGSQGEVKAGEVQEMGPNRLEATLRFRVLGFQGA